MNANRISLILAAAIAFPATVLADDGLDRALEAYQRSHYAESIRLLRPIAESGDLRAQEMLGFMHLYGEALYGAAIPRDRDQAAHWLRRAAAAGSTVAMRGLGWIAKQTAPSGVAVGTRPRPD